jgi:bifunctional non-homologous end joining protein LigD
VSQHKPPAVPILKPIEPAFIEPMQCKPVAALPTGEKWTFETKCDGYRCIAVKRGREVTLFSRYKKVLNKRFPGVLDDLASLDGNFVLDGELVALDSQGRPSFQVLQNNLSRSLPVYLYCFDLLNRAFTRGNNSSSSQGGEKMELMKNQNFLTGGSPSWTV